MSLIQTKSQEDVYYPETIIYPESDGEPIGETDWHIAVILYLRQALRYFFRNQQVYVAADLLFYYEEGETSVYKVPDVFVVKDVAPHDRRTYKLWEEDNKQPNIIFEITSKSTRWDDLTTKKALYELLGVQEYILFDPLDEYLKPNLQGYELVDGRYNEMKLDANGSLLSNELGLILRPEKHLLRLVDPITNEPIPTLEEQSTRLEESEAENERLRAELEKLRDQSNSEDGE